MARKPARSRTPRPTECGPADGAGSGAEEDGEGEHGEGVNQATTQVPPLMQLLDAMATLYTPKAQRPQRAARGAASGAAATPAHNLHASSADSKVLVPFVLPLRWVGGRLLGGLPLAACCVTHARPPWCLFRWRLPFVPGNCLEGWCGSFYGAMACGVILGHAGLLRRVSSAGSLVAGWGPTTDRAQRSCVKGSAHRDASRGMLGAGAADRVVP